MHKKECSLNLGVYVVRVKKKFLSMDLPNLGFKGLSVFIFLSYERYILSLEVYISTSVFWFKVVFNCF